MFFLARRYDPWFHEGVDKHTSNQPARTMTHINEHDRLDLHIMSGDSQRRWRAGLDSPEARRAFSLDDGYDKAQLWDMLEDDLARPYGVYNWGSHPDAGNDDCWIGGEYATLDEALKEFEDNVGGDDWITLLVSGQRIAMYEGTGRPDTPDTAGDTEHVMLAAMERGVDGYNEARGYDMSSPEPCGHHCQDDCMRCG